MLIDKILISNIQSWKNETIELSKDRINIFVAQNNTGKSVLIKLLYATALPNTLDKEDRENLIRFDEPYGRFVVQFIDGSVGYTQIQRDRIIYGYTEDGKNFTVYNSPPEIFIQKLGLLVDYKNNYIVNIVDGKQAMFLIDSDTKGNHSLIKLMMEYKDLNEFFENANIYSESLNKVEERLVTATAEVKRQLDLTEFIDVMKIEQDISTAEVLLEECERFNNISKLLSIVRSDTSNIRDYHDEINVADNASIIQDVTEKISDIKVGRPFRQELLSAYNNLVQLTEIQNLLNTINGTENKLPDVAEILDTILKVRELLNSINSIKSIAKEKQMLFDLVAYTKILNSTEILYNSLQKKDENDKAVNRIYDELIKSGKIVKCEVHGKVIYNGKECIPYNQ